MANPTPQFRWNERAGRFVDARSRRFISQSRVTAALNDVIDAAAAEMLQAEKAFRAGQMTFAQFQLIFENGIKNINITSFVMARGGYQAMSPSDWGRVGREIRTQYEYARKMYAQVASGAQPLNGTFTRRIRQYIESGRTVYEAERKRQAVLRGKQYVRSIRHARDSCAGCVTQAGYEWIPMDSALFVPVGNRDCRKNCRCSLEFATAEEAGIVEAA